ncbi:DUF2848 domain-containing protein [Acetobacteraceae bacterium H6797]|nr:DUF2848 domain-containing protein [Acetobacteraceae bacterium H6797]
MTQRTFLDFTIQPKAGTAATLSFEAKRLVIAGWAGRDQAALQHHIDELAALGVAPPSTTPLFYAATASLLTQAGDLQFLGTESSGEAEPLLVVTAGELLVGLGSDHTDRHAEAWSVAHSKQLCAKPIAATLWRFAEVESHWDQLILRSWIEEKGGWVLYQEGAVAGLRRPDELMALAGGLPPGTAMLCGTMPAIGGIRPAPAFRMELHDPVLERRIAHEYRVSPLPIVA